MIRQLQVNDIDNVILLEQESLGTTLGKSMLENMIENDFAKAYVYEIHNKIIGYISVTFDGEILEIMNFCVAKEYRRKKIASSLLNHIFTTYRQIGMKSAILEVRRSNLAALCLYEKYGFLKILVRKQYYSNLEDALVLQKNFE